MASWNQTNVDTLFFALKPDLHLREKDVVKISFEIQDQKLQRELSAIAIYLS